MAGKLTIRAPVRTKVYLDGRVESSITCPMNHNSQECRKHYKKTGQYENHLKIYHWAEIRAAILRDRPAGDGNNQGDTPLVDSAHRGFVQPLNGAALSPGTSTLRDQHMGSSDRVRPSAEYGTNIPPSATPPMNRDSIRPVSRSNRRRVSSTRRGSSVNSGNLVSPPTRNRNRAPRNLQHSVPQRALMSPSNGGVAMGIGGVAMTSTNTSSTASYPATPGRDVGTPLHDLSDWILNHSLEDNYGGDDNNNHFSGALNTSS